MLAVCLAENFVTTCTLENAPYARKSATRNLIACGRFVSQECQYPVYTALAKPQRQSLI